MTRKVSWKECSGPGSSVGLQLDDIFKEPRYDSVTAPDHGRMNLKETGFGEFSTMLTICSQENVLNKWPERHDHSKCTVGVLARTN